MWLSGLQWSLYNHRGVVKGQMQTSGLLLNQITYGSVLNAFYNPEALQKEIIQERPTDLALGYVDTYKHYTH